MSRVQAKKKNSEVVGDFRKLRLDPRVVNALAAQGIFALEDLTRFTDRDFAKLPGIGPGTCKILRDYLRKADQPHQTPAISLVLPAEMLKAIDRWCLAHPNLVPSRTDAIHTLVEVGLTTLKPGARPV